MALTRPILKSIIPFPSNTSFDFIFNTSGQGTQIVKNQLIIYKNSDNTEVYNSTIDSFQYKHTLSANTLVNGIEYKAKLRTGDAFNNYSDYSDFIVFKCLSTPIVSITNIIGGTVSNATFEFIGSYSQSENIPIESYKFILYDQYDVQLSVSDEKFGSDIRYEFTGFENSEQYKIELITINSEGVTTSSGKIPFTAEYITPKLNSVLNLENYPEEGAVKIQANIIRILGHGENYTFEDSEWLNVKNGIVWLDSENGFSLDNNFTLKIWLKDITDNITFLKLQGENNGIIELKYYDNRIHAFKTANNLVSHFASNEFNISETDTLFIFMQQINDLITLQCEKYN